MESAPGDFLVNTGDMVSMGNQPRDWSELFAIEGKLLRDRCVFAAVGNHELARGDHAGEVAFLRYFAAAEEGHELERLYGSFRWSNTRFFVLNAMDNWTGAERAWLRAELDRSQREPGLVHRIALMHWGPFSSGPHGDNPALASGEVIGLMRDRQVDLVLAGHDHDYERGAGGGLKYVITGGAGAPLYPRKRDGAEALRYESAYHFLEVAVDGDHVTVTARRPRRRRPRDLRLPGRRSLGLRGREAGGTRRGGSPGATGGLCVRLLRDRRAGRDGRVGRRRHCPARRGARPARAQVVGASSCKRTTQESSSISTPARGCPSGSASRARRCTATATGTAASTSGLWGILDGAPHLVFQRRSASKDTWPLALDVAVTGHARAGETVEATLREAEEEIGLVVRPADLVRLGLRRRADRRPGDRRQRAPGDLRPRGAGRDRGARALPGGARGHRGAPLRRGRAGAAGRERGDGAEALPGRRRRALRGRADLRGDFVPAPDGYYREAHASLAVLLSGGIPGAWEIG